MIIIERAGGSYLMKGEVIARERPNNDSKSVNYP